MRTKRCPVDVGDIFYRINHCIKTGAALPDRLEVVEVKEKDGQFFIRGKYLYHTVGTKERVFSDIIFRDPAWIIEPKGV